MITATDVASAAVIILLTLNTAPCQHGAYWPLWWTVTITQATITLVGLVQGHAIGHGSDGALVETVRVADALLALLVVGYVGEGVGLLLTSTQTQASLEVRDVVRGFARTAQLFTLSFCVETTEIIAVTHVALITTIN